MTMPRLTCRFLSAAILKKHCPPAVPHLPYSPDLNPTNLFMFSKLKHALKGCCFHTIEKKGEIQDNGPRGLSGIQESVFQKSFKKRSLIGNSVLKVEGIYLGNCA
ncbi:hypothetical protein CDAR_226921 [Caerostris darwini]|uniref:Uncharacterized protein n=1 Tax=Caerostris darwini TaxID=1538125 RepID=A0AAV4VVB7_9ARAC|nr:hypothetical protein CDAR_226921 [Caerostris darwini]